MLLGHRSASKGQECAGEPVCLHYSYQGLQLVVEKGSEGMQRAEETSAPEETVLGSQNSLHFPKSLSVFF